jgi:hypothetical protein
MIRKAIVGLFLIFILSVQAQEVKFGKISDQELSEKSYDKDSTASAAYLFKKRESYYTYSRVQGLLLVTEIHERLKIYDKKGFNYASKTINLYKNRSADESVSTIKGYTYNRVSGKIEETKLDKSGIFKSEYSKNQNQVKFTMPNVKEGSIIEYKYRITSPFIQSISEYVFQHDIPIRQLEAKIRILEYFKYNQRQKGFLILKPNTRVVRDATLGINVTETTYSLKDIPALKEEKYVSNIENFRSGVQYEVVSLEIPGSVYDVYSKSWEDVVETIYDSDSFGDELKQTRYFEKDLDSVLLGVDSSEEKVSKILSFVKSKVKWNSFTGVGTYEGVKKAYEEGTGNSADINLMLIAMLKYAMITTHPVLVSTRDHGIPLFPTIEGYNYVIAAIKNGNGYHLLDASDPYSTVDVLPRRALNWLGRIVSEEGNSETIDLMPPNKSVDIVMMNVSLKEDGSIEAKCRESSSHNNAMVFRNSYNKGTQDSFLEDFEKDKGAIEISDYAIKNNLDLDKPIIQEYDFSKEDVVEAIADKLYFTPMFNLRSTENPFKSEKRDFPVDYGYAWEDKFLINIEIPEGYRVESVPESTSVLLPENMGRFTYLIKATDKAVNLTVSVTSETAIVPPHHYNNLKDFYTMLVQKQNEKVVLSKI